MLLSSNTSGSLPNKGEFPKPLSHLSLSLSHPFNLPFNHWTADPQEPAHTHSLCGSSGSSLVWGQITTHLITSLSSSTILHCHWRTMASAVAACAGLYRLHWLAPALANRLIILSRVGPKTAGKNATRQDRHMPERWCHGVRRGELEWVASGGC